MVSKAPAVDHQSLGAWLLKGSRDKSSVDDLVGSRFETVTGWCVRRTYRADLIRSGQPVLFWISGRDDEHPAGIYAQGHTTGVAALELADDGRGHREPDRAKLVMPVELEPVEPPVLRTEMLQHPALRQTEVVRMPAGSNPSFLRKTHLVEVRRLWPQVSVV